MFFYMFMYKLHVKLTQKCMRHAMIPKYILTPNLGFLPQIIYSFALLNLSSWCLVIVVWLFLAVPWVYLQFVIVVFPDHTHLVFLEVKTENWKTWTTSTKWTYKQIKAE